MMTVQTLLSVLTHAAVVFGCDPAGRGWRVLAHNDHAGERWQKLAEDELNQLTPLLDACWQSAQPQEQLMVDCCGQKAYQRQVFSRLQLAQGDVILLQLFAVSDQSRLEEDMVTRFNLVVAGSKSGIYDWNIRDDRVYWSDRMKAILGAASYTFKGRPDDFWERMHADDRKQVEDALQGHLQHCWPFDVDCRVRTDAGYYVWVNITGQAVWNDQGEAERMAGSVVDITDRMRAQTELRQREKLIEQIIDALPLSVVVKDGQGCVRFFNMQTEQLTGLQREQALGRTDFEIYPPAQAHKYMVEELRLRREGGIQISEELRGEGEDARWSLIGKSLLRVKPFDGQAEDWILSFAIDITERKQSELLLKQAKEQAEEAAQSKSVFLSTMSHEIRTPLNSVIGTSSLLLDTPLNEEQQQYARMIRQGGEHLLGLINDILDYSKLEAGKMLVDAVPYRIADQLDAVTTIMTPQATHKALTLSIHVGQDVPPVVMGDAHKIRQVLLNLMSNAIKFTQTGGVRIEVSRRMDPQVPEQVWLHYAVMDTGIGIPSDKLNRLFEEFSQVDASTTRQYGGTGLGLAICRKLVELMGGQIGVFSTAGEGSQFWFSLPLMAADDDRDQVSEKTRTLASLEDQRPLSILVAEDNASNQMLIQAILRKLGHQSTIAPDGQQALEAVQQQDYDLVLMDMQMPVMDGLAATRAIRALGGRFADLPIVALTANALEGDKGRVLEAGMNDYLSKPIDIHKLKQALWRWSMSAVDQA